MPRNPDSPRASDVHWLSPQEKEDFLNSLNGESFSNYVRRLLNLPPFSHGGARQRPTPSGEAETGQRGVRKAKGSPGTPPLRRRR